MTPDELRAAKDQFYAIEAAKKTLDHKRQILALVNEYGKRGQIWEPELRLKRAEPYTHRQDVTVRIKIPFGVIQQQAVYEVEAAERALIQAGGQP